MAPLPKRRLSIGRQSKRRQATAVKLPKLTVCINCGAKTRSHVACPSCGFYKGKIVRENKSNKEKGEQS
jgi:large subunit ribosomal protein L32